MYIDQGIANKLAHDYQEIATDSAKIIARIIRKLRANNAIQKKSSHRVEIKVDNELVYKGETGKQPKVNKLTPKQLQMLESIIGSTSAKEVMVAVDGKAVYHSKDGIEKINQLSSQIQLNSAAPSQLLQLEFPTGEQEVRNLQVVVAARRILKTLGIDDYQSENYHLKTDGSDIMVDSQDGESKIAHSKEGLLTGSASALDVLLLSELEKKVNQEKAVEKPVQLQPTAGNNGNESQAFERD